MAVITLRSVKGSPLTIAEADANINNLNSELGGKLDITSYTPTDVLAKLLTVDGLGSGLDADRIQNRNIASTNTANTVVLRDSSGNFSAGTITANSFVGNITGNIVGNGTGTWTGTATGISGVVGVSNGGTGVTSVSDIRTLLSLGSISTQNSASVNITGGTITGINPIGIASGGTNANNAASARVNLGLNIGTDVQGFAPILSSITALSNNGVIVKTGSGTSSTAILSAGTNIAIANNDFISGNPTISLISSPALTGIPTAPTASAGTNTTQIATTSFVKTAVDTGDAAQQTYTDTRFNSVLGIAKAWVLFDGVTTNILSSQNVTSVTSNGSGQYTINITPGTFSTAGFIAFGMCGGGGTSQGRFVTFVNSSSTALVVYTLTASLTGSGTSAATNNGVVRIAMFN
jgi:hypothetical protein